MKKILFLLLLVSVLVFASSAYSRGFLTKSRFFSRSVCDKPITYRIGTIDRRFNLSEKQVESYLAQAESVWEKPEGKNLFEFNPNAKLQVDFVYDKKQALNSQINQLTGQLNAGKGDIETRRAEYEKQVADFNKQADDLNSQIAHWNSQGGAPTDEYGKLISKQQELSSEAEKLNSVAKDLDLSAQQYNLSVGKLNQRMSEFNQDLVRKPEGGLYDGQRQTIDIYFVPSEEELVHTLAHELGHARGLSHIEGNTDSIMFPYSSEKTVATSDDIDAVNLICKEKSLPEVVFMNFSLLLGKYLYGGAN
jgi:hypothetical protein